MRALRPPDGPKIPDADAVRPGLHVRLDAEHVAQEGGHQDRFGGAVGPEAAAVEDPQPVGEAGGEFEVVDRRNHGPARLGERSDAAHQVELVTDVEVGRRLVEEEEGSVLRERLGKERPLLLAAGEVRDGAVGEVPDVEGVEGRRHAVTVPLAERLGPPEVGRPAERDHLGDGEVDSEVGLLSDQGDRAGALPRRPGADLAVVEGEVAGVGDEARYCTEQRRFARSVRSHKGYALTGVHAERQPSEHAPAVEVDAEVTGGEDGHRGGGVRR